MRGRSSDQWSEFELTTKLGLEAIGYNVTRDVLLAGSQVDLYAERPHQLDVHRILVECKDHKGEISVEAVRQFAALVNACSTQARPVNGLMVSREGFTKQARAFAQEVNLSLLTLDGLLKLSFDPAPILSYITQSFERDDLQRVYVDLSCQAAETGKPTVYKPVEKFIDTFFATTKRPGIALLGNFGSGKTSLCKHYAYLLAKRWPTKGGEPFLPLYVDLRELQNLLDLETDLLRLLQRVYGATVTQQGWTLWLLNRPTLVLLDGFDEMASRMDKLEINRNVGQLAQFTIKYRAKLILTCRTHFFRTQIEEGALGNMLRLYVRDWGSAELVDYVSKSLPERTELSLKLIYSTYNLEELSRTPIFLNMITATIGDIGAVANKAKLYQVYTDRWIQNQDYRSKLSPDDKEQFMEELAFEMFSTGHTRIHHKVLPTKIKELLSVREWEALTALDSDIRTCSFLIRDPEGFYHFMHKSYMEFFVGFKLAKEMKTNKLANLAKRILSIEITGFFSNYFEGESDLLIRNLLGHSDPIVRANCALAIGCLCFSVDAFSALALSVRMDKSNIVRCHAVDALSSFKHKDATLELVKLAAEEGDFGVYCLKALGNSMEDSNVLDLCRNILLNPQNPDRVRIVLENITSSNSLALIDELTIFGKEGWWELDLEVAKGFVIAIQGMADLRLALLLKTIEKSPVVDTECFSLIEQVKYELKSRFRDEIEKEAIEYKAEGATRPKNTRRIRAKYSFLVDDEYFSKLLMRLYPEVAKRKTRKRKSKRG
jgi:predicted RecB family endonuclease